MDTKNCVTIMVVPHSNKMDYEIFSYIPSKDLITQTAYSFTNHPENIYTAMFSCANDDEYGEYRRNYGLLLGAMSKIKFTCAEEVIAAFFRWNHVHGITFKLISNE